MIEDRIGMSIEWSDEFSVNMATVDDQHKRLIFIIQSLEKAISKGRAQHVLTDIITELMEYTRVHFSYEESLFNEYNYPEKEQHKQQHTEFVDKMKAFKAQHDAGSIVVSKDIVIFVSEWIADHIGYRDKKYGVYFVANGFLALPQKQ
jgi:hemerythrin